MASVAPEAESESVESDLEIAGEVNTSETEAETSKNCHDVLVLVYGGDTEYLDRNDDGSVRPRQFPGVNDSSDYERIEVYADSYVGDGIKDEAGNTWGELKSSLTGDVEDIRRAKRRLEQSVDVMEIGPEDLEPSANGLSAEEPIQNSRYVNRSP